MAIDEGTRAALLAQQERAQTHMKGLEADLDALTRARRSESDDDEHDPEGVTLSSQWSMLSGLLESARDEVRQVEDALQRLDAGSYGICTDCGQPIPAEQLEVRPFRQRCVACSS